MPTADNRLPTARRSLSANCPLPALGCFEIFWILLIFFLFAGSPPPDVGEAHYLTKAKHYWNPEWCAGDLFLESADAHLAFYWTFGWITQFVSLPATAWIGRFVTWLLLAWSWRRLSVAIVPGAWYSLLTAGLMLGLLRWFHMAGEWVVGGVEAKGLAYVFVFLALESLVRERWNRAWLCVGAASALHVLVGGWSAIALGFAWLAAGSQRPSLVRMGPAVLGGLLLSLPGVLPALWLTAGSDPQLVAAASRSYVFERLSHHLVFHRFARLYLARHAVLFLAWIGLAWYFRNEKPLQRLNQFIAAAVLITACGIFIDQVLLVGLGQVDLGAKLLRYYWFRLSDALLPVGVGLMLVAVVRRLKEQRPQAASWLLIGLMLLAGANLAEICYRRSQLRLPGSFLQPRPEVDQPTDLTATELFTHWRNACDWVRENTPADARFLTPRRQQTFRWYAQRPEVATWKDVPQDALGLVEWQEAIGDLFPRRRGIRDLGDHSDAELIALARKYNAQYVVIDRTRTRPGRQIGLPRVYPADAWQNPAYEVYRVDVLP